MNFYILMWYSRTIMDLTFILFFFSFENEQGGFKNIIQTRVT